MREPIPRERSLLLQEEESNDQTLGNYVRNEVSNQLGKPLLSISISLLVSKGF